LPGAVCLGHWDGENWQMIGYEALCTLDAGRFRLPLSAAVRRLTATAPTGTLLIERRLQLSVLGWYRQICATDGYNNGELPALTLVFRVSCSSWTTQCTY